MRQTPYSITDASDGDPAPIPGTTDSPMVGVTAGPGACSGGGADIPKSPLETARETLMALMKERDTNPSEELDRRIKQAEARVQFRERQEKPPTRPVADTLGDMCVVCQDKQRVNGFGTCTHNNDFCGGCVSRMVETRPASYETYVDGYFGIFINVTTMANASFCPLCCDGIVVTSPNYLGEAEQFVMENRRNEAVKEERRRIVSERIAREDRRDAERNARLEAERIARVARLEAERIAREERRASELAEKMRIAELNRARRQEVIRLVRLREELRQRFLRMMARDEPIPDDFEIPSPSPTLPGFCCEVNCRIPMRGGNYLDYSTQPEETVTPLTTCTHCRQSILGAWDFQEMEVIRGEERRRVDEMLIAAQLDRERRRETLLRLEERDRQFAQASDIERPFRECLERELAAAGDNVKAREKAQSKFERNLEEAQRKASRKDRRRR